MLVVLRTWQNTGFGGTRHNKTLLWQNHSGRRHSNTFFRMLQSESRQSYKCTVMDIGPSHTHRNNDLNFSKRKKLLFALARLQTWCFHLPLYLCQTEGVFQIKVAQLVHADHPGNSWQPPRLGPCNGCLCVKSRLSSMQLANQHVQR